MLLRKPVPEPTGPRNILALRFPTKKHVSSELQTPLLTTINSHSIQSPHHVLPSQPMLPSRLKLYLAFPRTKAPSSNHTEKPCSITKFAASEWCGRELAANKRARLWYVQGLNRNTRQERGKLHTFVQGLNNANIPSLRGRSLVNTYSI